MVSGLVWYSSTLVIFTCFELYYNYILYYTSELNYSYIVLLLILLQMLAVGSSVGRVIE